MDRNINTGAGRGVMMLLLFLFMMHSASLRAQLSPGELTEAHAHLEGMSHCTDCHTLGARVANEKCLACHVEIKTRMESQKGYHSSTQIRDKECASCHSEHHGRTFRIINFDTMSFDHSLTGYELLGAHRKEECKDCHKQDFIVDEKIRSKDFSFLGLSTECLSCHEDYHQKTLSNECTQCHGMDFFKPAVNFSHEKTDYPLEGKHKSVECEKCHKVEIISGSRFQYFAGIPFGNCTDCHRDVHQGKFGQDCRQCHSVESFRAPASLPGFDHDRTNYPLEGKHRQVNCRNCHKTSLTDPLQHDRCTQCHADYHKGQLVREGSVQDCASCHSVEGFSPPMYTIERHNRESSFILEGAHLATPCFSCHKKEDRWAFRNIGLRCADCHQDIHQGHIDEKYYPEDDCRVCHRVDHWSNVSFDHSRTTFELSGAHEKVSCRSCHFKTMPDGKLAQRFTELSSRCAECHVDTHAGQFDRDGYTDCSRCHTPQAWKIEGFDHSNTRFPLDGRHAGVACGKCHKAVGDQNKKYIQYKFDDIRCEACHL